MVAYIALAAAFFTYWFTRESCIAALKEFATMGIAAYFRQIKEEVINEAKAEAEAKGRAEGREIAISELRAMPRDEALALLECQDTDTDSDAESPPPANGQTPQA